MALEEADDVAIADLRLTITGGHAARQAIELSCGVLCRNIRALVGGTWQPQAVLFRHAPPATLEVHRRVFGLVPQFGQDLDGLVLRRAELDEPLPGADPTVAQQAERLVRHLMERRSRSTSERVSELIVLLLPTGACAADRVARHLGCDRRTMHRRLAAEGTGFSDLLHLSRREIVRSLIADPRRSITAIADLAGFSSPSSFSHWSRREFGASPRAVREGAAAGSIDPQGVSPRASAPAASPRTPRQPR